MAYNIYHTNGDLYTELSEGVLDQRLGISLIGQNFHNYGQLIATNFLQLLENQAKSVPPSNPVEGQLWWNTATKQLNYFNGNQWKTSSNTTINIDPPFKPVDGDQWWDTSLHQLKVHNGVDWVVIGPLNPEGQHFSGVMPITASDDAGHQHTIATVNVDGVVIGILNKDESFTLASPIAGIAVVGKGVTYSPSTMLTGTVQNSLQLGGVDYAKFVRTTDAASVLEGSMLVKNMLSVGSSQDPLRIYSDTIGDYAVAAASTNVRLSSGAVALHINGTNNTVSVSVEPTLNTSVTTKRYVDILVASTDLNTRTYVDAKASAIVGGIPVVNTLTKLSTAIHNDPNYANNVTAALNFKAPVFSPDFTGTPQSITVPHTDSTRKLATTEFVHNVISAGITSLGTLTGLTVAADIMPATTNMYNVGSPVKKFNNFYGNAMITTNADLAENYKSDTMYKTGTVVVFGGKYEITTSDQYCDHRVAGIISDKPAYLMNDTASREYQAVALTGKVPCLVVGAVKKGDILVNSEFTGVAKTLTNTNNWLPGCVIGKSLEDNSDEGIRTVIVAVGRF